MSESDVTWKVNTHPTLAIRKPRKGVGAVQWIRCVCLGSDGAYRRLQSGKTLMLIHIVRYVYNTVGQMAGIKKKQGASDMNECCTYHQPGVLRVLQTKEETKAFYNKIAKVYDALAEHSEAAVRKAGLDILHARPGQRILEIGFGTGHSLIELARSVGPSGMVVGIDLSEQMVEISRKRVDDEGLRERIELSCGDALHLPYESESLDGIFMSFTLELFDTPEIPLVLAECRRVLKPGGRIVVIGMSRVEPDGLLTEIFEWTHRHFPNYLDCRPILVRQALEDSGFQITDHRIMKMWISVEVVCGARFAEGTDST